MCFVKRKAETFKHDNCLKCCLQWRKRPHFLKEGRTALQLFCSLCVLIWTAGEELHLGIITFVDGYFVFYLSLYFEMADNLPVSLWCVVWFLVFFLNEIVWIFNFFPHKITGNILDKVKLNLIWILASPIYRIIILFIIPMMWIWGTFGNLISSILLWWDISSYWILKFVFTGFLLKKLKSQIKIFWNKFQAIIPERREL